MNHSILMWAAHLRPLFASFVWGNAGFSIYQLLTKQNYYWVLIEFLIRSRMDTNRENGEKYINFKFICAKNSVNKKFQICAFLGYKLLML
jgi:hypothetical protein